jgi:hypothetical protein
MYTILITQEVHCRNQAHAFGLWTGSEEYKCNFMEAVEIKVFEDGEEVDDEIIQLALNIKEACAKIKEVFAL